jgi:hypothetical protein
MIICQDRRRDKRTECWENDVVSHRTTLHCPNETYKAEVRSAIEQGVLTWTAFPFNSELAAYDPSLIAFGINHTHALDDYFGVKRKITFPDRDVPGVSRSLIPILLENGIGAINESPNGAMYPTNVPPAFVWKDTDSVNSVVNQQHGVSGVAPPSNKEIVVMWCEKNHVLCKACLGKWSVFMREFKRNRPFLCT